MINNQPGHFASLWTDIAPWISHKKLGLTHILTSFITFIIGFAIAVCYKLSKQYQSKPFFTISKVISLPYTGDIFLTLVAMLAVIGLINTPSLTRTVGDIAHRQKIVIAYIVSQVGLLGLCYFKTNLEDKVNVSSVMHLLFACIYFSVNFYYYHLVIKHAARLSSSSYKFLVRIFLLLSIIFWVVFGVGVMFESLGIREYVAILEWALAFFCCTILAFLWNAVDGVRTQSYLRINAARPY